jgi:hypothetical protein
MSAENNSHLSSNRINNEDTSTADATNSSSSSSLNQQQHVQSNSTSSSSMNFPHLSSFANLHPSISQHLQQYVSSSSLNQPTPTTNIVHSQNLNSSDTEHQQGENFTTVLLNNNQVPQTATATTAATNENDDNSEESEASWFGIDPDIREMILKAIPLIVLPSLLFLYFHFIGVITVLWLGLALFSVHERLKQQVSLKEERSLWMSLLLVVICGAHISLLYFFLMKYQPWYYLAFMTPTKQHLDFWNSLFFVVVTDCVLKLTSMIIKCFVVIVIGPMKFIPNAIKGRIYANIETLFYTYRCCLPLPVWIRYLFGPTYHIAFSILVTGIYSIFKLRSILDSIWKSLLALKALFSTTAPFGRYATREEVLEADDSCSICQDEFKKPISLNCGHLYCEECISTWFSSQSGMTCPICRAKQPETQLKYVDGSSNLGVFCL